MATLLIFGQLLIAFFAWYDARGDVGWSWPFRVLSTDVFPAEAKKQQTAIAKRNRFIARMPVVCAASLFIFNAGNGISIMLFVWYVLYVFLLGVWFWGVFDISFATGISQDWHYTGTTSEIDNKISGRGKLKAFLCAGVIAILNGLFFIFFL